MKGAFRLGQLILTFRKRKVWICRPFLLYSLEDLLWGYRKLSEVNAYGIVDGIDNGRGGRNLCTFPGFFGSKRA